MDRGVFGGSGFLLDDVLLQICFLLDLDTMVYCRFSFLLAALRTVG